jgi:hypothetical protein
MANQVGKQYNIADLSHRKASDFRSVYANASMLGANFYDVNLLVGEIQGGMAEELPYVEDRVAITMSWEHLKALGGAIQKAVTDYEKHGFGAIRDKPEGNQPASN